MWTTGLVERLVEPLVPTLTRRKVVLCATMYAPGVGVKRNATVYPLVEPLGHVLMKLQHRLTKGVPASPEVKSITDAVIPDTHRSGVLSNLLQVATVTANNLAGQVDR